MAHPHLETLLERSNKQCELCNSTSDLAVHEVVVDSLETDKSALLCPVCTAQVNGTEDLNTAHLFCLNESAWSQVPAIQVIAYRLLHKLNSETWAQDLLEQIYLEDDVKALAEAGLEDDSADTTVVKDGFNNILVEGDTITVIKELDVKGANFVVKRGTIVRNIRLGDDPTHVEGKVNGSSIFLKTCFLKKL
jgi:protein PhnA